MVHQPFSQIRFQSYNPYESLYPGLRVVSRDTLHLIKILRAEGYSVVVEPDDGTKLNYFVEKGIREILSDPACMLIINIEISLLMSLLANWLYDQLKRPLKSDEVKTILEFDERGNKVRYSQSGQPISDEKFKSLLASLELRKRQFEEARKLAPPNSDFFLPIFLEHTEKIVGWSKGLIFDDEKKRIGVDTAKIFDDETWKRIQSGELKGWSFAGIVPSATCLICGGEYVDCNHIAGIKYNGRECQVRYTLLPAEISIVKEPVQPIARVEKA